MRPKVVFSYLKAAQGAVVEGLEDHEKIYALEQAQYIPVRTLAGEQGNSAILRFELTADQRQMVADGADILLELLHFGGPLAPSRVMLLNQAANELKEANPQVFRRWFAIQTNGPYLHALPPEVEEAL